MTEYIDRQAAIDSLESGKDKTAKGDIGGFYNAIIQNDIDKLINLPAAQTEIIRCIDCVHYTPLGIGGAWGRCPVHSSPTEKQRTCQSCDFCSWAERKTDE